MSALGIWLLALLISILGVGVLIELGKIVDTLRLMDVAC